jgi:hypothetical protein
MHAYAPPELSEPAITRMRFAAIAIARMISVDLEFVREGSKVRIVSPAFRLPRYARPTSSVSICNFSM